MAKRVSGIPKFQPNEERPELRDLLYRWGSLWADSVARPVLSEFDKEHWSRLVQMRANDADMLFPLSHKARKMTVLPVHRLLDIMSIT